MNHSLLRSTKFAWISFLLAPPLGIVLVWLQGSVWRTVKVVATVAVLPLTFFYLNLLTGLRIQFAGDMVPIVEFWRPSRHIARLEEHRSHMNRPLAHTESTVHDAESSPAEPLPAAAWPGFRGPNRDGIVAGLQLADWPAAGLRELWRQPVGGGHGSFAIAYGRAFTIEQRREQEVVTCYDLNSGSELWSFPYHADFRELMGGPGPRATPTIDGDRLYALGAVGHLHCLDTATGKLLWQVNILADNEATNLQWAMSGSPLVDGERVIVNPGGRSGKSVVAYDRETGKCVWRGGDDPAGYASPTIGTLCGVRQVLTFTGNSIVGNSLADGRQLWRHPWETYQMINVCQPIVLGDDRIFISSSYGNGAAVLQLSARDERIEVRTVWQTQDLKLKFASAVHYDGFLYGLDESILVCLDPATGKRRWKGGRYGYGQLLLAGDSLVIQAESGEVVRVRATPDRHEELSRFRALPDKTWNYPAIGEGKLLVRNAREMACYELR